MSHNKKAKNYPNPDAFNSSSAVASSHDMTGAIPSGIDSVAEYNSYTEVYPLTNQIT